MSHPDNEARINNPEREAPEVRVAYSRDKGIFREWLSDVPQEEINGVLVNVFHGQTPVGYVEASIERELSATSLFIEDISIEDTTKLRKGYGSILLDKTEQTAKEQGISLVEGIVDKTDSSSVEFFTHHGYLREEYYENGRPEFRVFKSI